MKAVPLNPQRPNYDAVGERNHHSSYDYMRLNRGAAKLIIDTRNANASLMRHREKSCSARPYGLAYREMRASSRKRSRQAEFVRRTDSDGCAFAEKSAGACAGAANSCFFRKRRQRRGRPSSCANCLMF